MFKERILNFILVGLLCLSGSAGWANALQLTEDFGDRQDAITAELVAQYAGQDSADVYRALNQADKPAFLQAFWRAHNPVLLRFYYAYLMGHHHLTVSDAFFERGELIPHRYKTGAIPPDSAMVSDAVRVCREILQKNPDELIAQNALGYCLLEQGKGVEAERVFLYVLKKDKRFLAARHGRALACLIQKKQVGRALDFFQDTVSLDDGYEAAVYNMAMCHLARRSVDINHHFGNVIKRFPNHYDAYYKLGVFYESLYYFDKAVKALSQQVVINPSHDRARGRLARVSMEMKYLNQKVQTTPQLRNLARKDPVRYLPILGAQYLDEEQYDLSAEVFGQYLALLPANERVYYENISLLLSSEDRLMYRMVRGEEKQAFEAYFWRKQDPTPTTPVNQRQLEHYRRVYYARQNFSEGRDPWDARGDIYVRFGHPDHRSWSDHLVFETDPDVVRVKNRLAERAGDALLEAIPDNTALRIESFGEFTMMMAPEVRGVPIFPLPHQGALFRDGASLNAKWETWVYAHIGKGFEVTFLDALGEFDFQFPQPPVNSPNEILWREMAPEAVVERVIQRTPSVYSYLYEKTPIPLYVTTADARATRMKSRLDVAVGVPWSTLDVKKQPKGQEATVKRVTVLFDTTGTEVLRDSLVASAVTGKKVGEPGMLWVDQVTGHVKPGRYFLTTRVEDAGSGGMQIFRQEIEVEAYDTQALGVSDLTVAGKITALSEQADGKFVRGDLEVVPLPSLTFKPEQSVFLYYEIYNLDRDETGQTHYKVDYKIKGADASAGVRLLRGIGQLLGVVAQDQGVTVSYEHHGSQANEPVFVALDVSSTAEQQIEISVQVTDQYRKTQTMVNKTVRVMIGDDS